MVIPSTAPQRLRPSVVEGLLDELDAHEDGLSLDLRKIGTIERSAGAVLSNALLGSLGTRPLRVILGENPGDWMITSGLAFALANREGPTVIEGVPGELRESRWARDWRPGHVEPLRAMMPSGYPKLFEPEQLGETAALPDLFGPTFAAFVNPHLVQPVLQRHPLTTLLWPWLDRLVPHSETRSIGRDRRARWIADVGRLVDEVVGNICEHARYMDRRRVYSFVQVSVTRGGGERSTNRLHLCVQDTGPGIPATARPKMSPPLAATVTEAQLVGRLLEGSLAPWGRGRGQGLPQVVEICRRMRGTLRVATKTSRASIDAQSEVAAVHISQVSFRLDGTVLALTVPVPGL